MRALILAMSILTVVASADVANAGLSSSPREATEPADPAIAAKDGSQQDANQQTENQIGLTKAKRRAVQRGLTRLGFDTKANGTFDDQTRAAISRWQEERSYPATGFLNPAQHKVLMTAATEAAKSDRQARRSSGRARGQRNVGGPIGAIGGAMHRVVGGIFGR
ncbi:peptidoglycan-binding domain-containing protein [Bradyrhizobium sp. SRS-191]|uniref:peptidoglycan-binding domain-containing protein n=1 Tax=Bradyrhizobium sp. SRS-191 TaxID=2962606 RepID=UPI00211F1335|nr:peptidoglycan-binding domain-containing protein [Bradyrhizobium sp. SRS-191]